MKSIYAAIHRLDETNHRVLKHWHNRALCDLSNWLTWHEAGHKIPLSEAWNRHTCEV